MWWVTKKLKKSKCTTGHDGEQAGVWQEGRREGKFIVWVHRTQVFPVGTDKPFPAHRGPETHEEKIENKGQGSSQNRPNSSPRSRSQLVGIIVWRLLSCSTAGTKNCPSHGSIMVTIWCLNSLLQKRHIVCSTNDHTTVQAGSAQCVHSHQRKYTSAYSISLYTLKSALTHRAVCLMSSYDLLFLL